MDLIVESLEKLEMKILGESYSITLPTVKQTREFSKKYKEAVKSEDESLMFDVMLEYLEGLGLPKDKSENLQLSTLLKISSLLNRAKKN